jgi:aminobenzoyl-glutamate utilization protein B
MTDTKCEIELLDAIYNVLPNKVLEELLDESMKAAGPPSFSEADMEFASKIAAGFEGGQKEAFFRASGLPQSLKNVILNDTVVPMPVTPEEPKGSTDVGDVSWCCPTAQFATACMALGTPGHSWQFTAQAGMGIGHAGMIAASKVLAEAGLRLLTGPEIIEKAKSEWKAATGGKAYKCAMPPEHMPPFHQLAKN